MLTVPDVYPMTRCVGVGIDQVAANLLSTANAGTTESMGRSKRTPERSQLVRATTPAFSRRQRGGSGSEDSNAPTASASEKTQTEIEPVEADAPIKPIKPTETTQIEIKPIEDRESIETQPMQMRPDPKDLPAIEPPDPRAEPWPDATPQPMAPVEPSDFTRPRTATVAMPTAAQYGRPPEMPRTTAPPPLVLGDVENPAHMPGPREVPSGDPGDPAPAPGSVPPGDSRSLRRDDEFALIYRVGTCVISRTGRVGTRGQWRVVEYPTSAAAANSYAKECSRFVSEGFSDYRE